MATPLSNVSFTSPGFDYGAEQSEIARRQAFAQAMQQQALQPTETQMAGGWAIPNSPFQGLAKLMQAYSSNKGYESAQEGQRELASKAQRDLADVLKRGTQAQTGTPASMSPGSELSPAFENPAVAPDMGKAAEAYMSHPMTAALGVQMAGDQAKTLQRQQALAQLLRGGAGTPQGQPPASAGSFGAGIPPQIMGLMTSGDPELAALGKALLEANKGIAQRPGAPVVNPFTGAVIAQPTPSVPAGVALQVGPGGPQAYQVPGAQGAMANVAASQAGATEAGKAPYQLQTVNTEGAPTLMTHQQAIQAATGQPMPQPGAQAQPQAQAASMGTTPPPQPGTPEYAAYSQVKSGAVPTAYVPQQPQKTPGLRLQDQSQSAANTEAGREFIAEMRQNYSKLRDVPATLANMEKAKELAASDAKQFMGPLGESKLYITKFMRNNLPGMGNLNTEGVTSAEQLQSTLFNQVMDNLKKMDASPSQYQQQVMQEAFGTLRTDPQSMPKILDTFADILKNRVAIHNETVDSAEGRGTQFPHDVHIKLPAAKAKADPQAIVDELRRRGAIK